MELKADLNSQICQDITSTNTEKVHSTLQNSLKTKDNWLRQKWILGQKDCSGTPESKLIAKPRENCTKTNPLQCNCIKVIILDSQNSNTGCDMVTGANLTPRMVPEFQTMKSRDTTPLLATPWTRLCQSERYQLKKLHLFRSIDLLYQLA